MIRRFEFASLTIMSSNESRCSLPSTKTTFSLFLTLVFRCLVNIFGIGFLNFVFTEKRLPGTLSYFKRVARFFFLRIFFVNGNLLKFNLESILTSLQFFSISSKILIDCLSFCSFQLCLWHCFYYSSFVLTLICSRLSWEHLF